MSKDTPRSLLIELRDRYRFREPNSDHMERCRGCHRSPYNRPPHDNDCIVPRIAAVLAQGGR